MRERPAAFAVESPTVSAASDPPRPYSLGLARPTLPGGGWVSHDGQQSVSYKITITWQGDW